MKGFFTTLRHRFIIGTTMLVLLGIMATTPRTDAQSTTTTTVCPAAWSITPPDARGPFFLADTPLRTRIAREEQLADLTNVLYVQGTIYGNDCVPMKSLLVEPWYAGEADDDDDGTAAAAAAAVYSSADSDFLNYRGRIITSECGAYAFTSTFPQPYPGRPQRHIHFRISDDEKNIEYLVTQMYFEGDDSNFLTGKANVQYVNVVTKEEDGSRSVVFNIYLNVPGTATDIDYCHDAGIDEEQPSVSPSTTVDLSDEQPSSSSSSSSPNPITPSPSLGPGGVPGAISTNDNNPSSATASRLLMYSPTCPGITSLVILLFGIITLIGHVVSR